MQFHLNGFRAGNPEIADPSQGYTAPSSSGSLPHKVDVLIVGCGPGLTLAAQLAAFPGIRTRIVDQKSGPLRLGQADGIACRTMEKFEAFGFSERVAKEAWRCAPQILHTYSAEPQAVAKELIDFDREWAQMLSAPAVDPAEVQRYFIKHGRYTAGTVTRYKPSIISAEPTYQHLAEGLVVGMRFHSAPVIRLADARAVQLGHTLKADGRWRVLAFSGPEDPAAPSSRIRALCDFLGEAPKSPVRRYTPAGADMDSVIDFRAIFQQGHRELSLEFMPALLLPRKGSYGLRDCEKMFSP